MTRGQGRPTARASISRPTLPDSKPQGLLLRIDRPINKDTELHPLVRWQFQGGIPEDERRAFLFTNVTDSSGRRYEIPVVVGALAASAKIYAIGMGCAVEEIGAAWTQRDRESHRTGDDEVGAVLPASDHQGDGLRKPGGGLASLPVPISTPGFDAAPYLTATLCVTRDPETGVRNMGTYRAALKATDRLGVRMASRIGGAGGYLALVQVSRPPRAHALRDCDWLRAGGRLHRAAKISDERGRDGGCRRRWRARPFAPRSASRLTSKCRPTRRS